MTDDRLDRMQAAIDSLTGALARLEERVTDLEHAAPDSGERVVPPPSTPSTSSMPTSVEEPAPAPSPPTGVPVVHVFSVVGTAFLVLAGAFLLRSFTETGALGPLLGAGLGLAYALGWLVVADRAGARGATLTASILGVAAVLIAYPLLWEVTSKLEALTPVQAAALLTAMTGLTMLVAWRRGLRALAWAATLATLGSCTGLLWATTAMEIFTVPVLLLGILTLWLSYTRDWGAMRWLTAVAVDLFLLPMLFLLGRTTETPGRFDHLSVPFFLVLCAGLLVGYLGSFAAETLVRRGKAGVFEAMQTAGVLLFGFGGAVRVEPEGGWGIFLLGVSGCLGAAACYAAAFAFVDRRVGRGTNFFYFAWLALVLFLIGSPLLLPASVLPHLWLLLALAAAFLGGRHDRITLRAHCAVFAAGAAWTSGMVRTGVDAFSAPTLPAWGGALWIVLPLTLACYLVLAVTQGGRRGRWLERLPRVLVLLLGVVGLGGLTVVLTTGLFPAPDAAVVAVLRTAVLSASAVFLAALGRKRMIVEMSWLPYPLLVVGGLKLLAEDLPQGRPVTIFLAFTCYGIALITAPRLQRRTARSPQSVGAKAMPELTSEHCSPGFSQGEETSSPVSRE